MANSPRGVVRVNSLRGRGGVHRGDELKATLRKCADILLMGVIVSERPSNRPNPRAQGGFRNNPPIPDFIVQFIARDDSIPVLDQVAQQLKDLRLEMHRALILREA
jgi:hypothetical protein